MGKKLAMGLMVLALFGVFGGVGQAAVWTDTTDLTSLVGIGTYTYTHDMDPNFSVPPDEIISASLTLSYKKGIGFGSVYVAGTYVGSQWVFDFDQAIETEVFNISGALDPYAGGPLSVTLAGVSAICFTQSDLRIEYTNVPEPSTLLLLGSGLLGLVGYGRRKMN